jgi:predicted lysophospholipase L1 biosynthesis ABC-type transport system permease subunit
VPDAANRLIKKTHEFSLRGSANIAGPFDDPYWTPPFPGITDKLKVSQWENPPFPYDPRRIKKADDDYWERYKTTPRLYVSLEKGQELWGTRFGRLTSYRVYPIAPDAKPDFEQAARRLEKQILAHLDPAAGGFVFLDVKTQALRSGGGATDFGGLFLGFSFFLIAAALLLVGLLVRLNLERRAQEMGLLIATGWRHTQVRRLLLAEGGFLTLAGSAIGLVAALVYTGLLLGYLKSNWPGGDGLPFLKLHVTATSLVMGWGASILVSMLALLWATRLLGLLEP